MENNDRAAPRYAAVLEVFFCCSDPVYLRRNRNDKYALFSDSSIMNNFPSSRRQDIDEKNLESGSIIRESPLESKADQADRLNYMKTIFRNMSIQDLEGAINFYDLATNSGIFNADEVKYFSSVKRLASSIIRSRSKQVIREEYRL